MKTETQLFVLAAVAAMIGLFTNNASAQGFDRAAMRERQLQSARDRIEVKSEEDWKKLEPLVAKVMDARDAARLGIGGFGGGGGRGAGRGGADGGANADQGGGRQRGGGFFGRPSPEVEALQKALDDKAPAEEVKEKLAKVRESRKAKETALEKAQDDLRKALTPRQEAGAVVAGLLR